MAFIDTVVHRYLKYNKNFYYILEAFEPFILFHHSVYVFHCDVSQIM